MSIGDKELNFLSLFARIVLSTKFENKLLEEVSSRMRKREDWDSETRLDFTLDCSCLQDYIVIITSMKDQETLQYSSRFNQILPTEACKVQFSWREHNE